MLRLVAGLLFALSLVLTARADELVYAYEANVLPYATPEQWVIADECDQLCSESLDGGHFVVSAPSQTDWFNYDHSIAIQKAPPATLWVEWRFRSNHPLGPNHYTCDAWFTVDYKQIHEWILMYGDAIFPASLVVGAFGLALDEFHTYRFESLDGLHYRLSADGDIFLTSQDNNQPNEVHYLQFGGDLGCGVNDWVPNMRNEWDMIRYGTIGYGERIIEADPPRGYLRPDEHEGRTRFTVRYDSPNYVYTDDIAVSVSGGVAPVVTATRRLDNGPPDVVEIVLDRAIPAHERTTFTVDDGSGPDGINIVAYTFQKGDVDADGQWNLHDFAVLQNCYYRLADLNTCAAFDYDTSIVVDAPDVALFIQDLGS